MSLDPVTAGIDLVSSIITRVWPDRTAQEKAQLDAALRADDNFTKLMVAQIAVNQAEASSNNMFVAGWRPACGWVCTAIFAYNYLLQPLGLFLCSAAGHPLPPPIAFDVGAIMPVLMGMLGLAGYRTYEKKIGVVK